MARVDCRRFGVEKSSGGKLALPVLAVGMGIYLPPSVNMPIVAGAVLAAVLKHIIGKKAENREGRLKNAERIGTLFSAGLIVGESLIGVIMAFIIAFSVTNGGSDAPLALNLQNWDAAASWLGLAFFVTGMFFFAQRVLKAGR
ncbi:membrane protein [Neisseria meningitidis]|nr:membrane protein [Neisseria meningitidis]